MKFKRFCKPGFLQGIGRPLLGRFFDRFNESLTATGIGLPSPDAGDDAYFKSLAATLATPEGLPNDMIEAMHVIEETSNEEGQERLENAVNDSGLQLEFDAESSHGDIAMQVWLVNPDILFQTHTELRLGRLTSFEYFGNKGDKLTCIHDNGGCIEQMKSDLDPWFKAHNRGHLTTDIQTHTLDGEFWYVIRHGDTFARRPKIENQKLEILHFRPAKDDVVVYSPDRNEIRIHAATEGERKLYRATFGERLFGNPAYFSERKTYTLEPLRRDGADSLDVGDISEITQIVLREFEVAWPGGFHETLRRRSDDIFAAAAARGNDHPPIPESGRMVRAVFDFQFADSTKPRKVEIRPPNVLKLGRYCDASAVHKWITAQGFRDVEGVEGVQKVA